MLFLEHAFILGNQIRLLFCYDGDSWGDFWGNFVGDKRSLDLRAQLLMFLKVFVFSKNCIQLIMLYTFNIWGLSGAFERIEKGAWVAVGC